jgi:hypothetical protein
VLEALGAFAHLVMHMGAAGVGDSDPRLCLRDTPAQSVGRGKRWRIALVGAQYHPRFALSELAAFALPHWLQSGLVAIESGYEPSSERPFLALDMQTRVLRAYALREVRLPEPSVELSDRPEAHNPDGSRVESDHTLAPDAAQAAHAEKLRLRQGALPAYAVPYGNYWLRARTGGLFSASSATAPPARPRLRPKCRRNRCEQQETRVGRRICECTVIGGCYENTRLYADRTAVVIAIIAVLAAILFPVFAEAREKGRQTVCISNQRHWRRRCICT